MKLQRHGARADYGGGTYPVEDDGGEYYLAADVDALLASIRAAVDAERATLPDCLMISKLAYHFGDRWAASKLGPIAKVRAALDALLRGDG